VGCGAYSSVGARPVKLYDVETGQETAVFPGPEGGVNDLAFHRDGRQLAVAGSGIVEVWDIVAHKKVHELLGHSQWVYCVAFSPDGKWLATGGWDRTIKLRDATNGEERLTIFAHEGFVLDLAFSPDSRCLASTSEDRSVRLWDVPTGRQIGVLHGHTDFVQAVAFAHDGTELASGGLEGTLKVWDRRTSLPVVIDGHPTSVAGFWYRREGRRIISFTSPLRGPATWKSWDPSTGALDPTLDGIDRAKLGDEYLPYPIQITPGVAPLRTSATSPDGHLLASVLGSSVDLYESDKRSQSYATTAVEVRDVATDRVLYTLIGHTADVICIAFSPDGRRIATTSYDRTVKLWDTATGREVFTLRGHSAGVVALAFSPDGRRIVSGGLDNTARVWDGTPLPADILQAQEARYQHKVTELKAFRDMSQGKEHAQGRNGPSQQGPWDLAAGNLGKYVENAPYEFLYAHILSLLAAGDKVRVQRACEDLLRRFGNAADPAQANRVAWCCVLASDEVSDPEVPVRLAEEALARGTAREKSDVLITLGAALYRAGRFEESIRRLNESIQTRGDGGIPQAFAFLALAHHRLGNHDEAKRWLDKLVASQPKKGFDISWQDVELRILRREAESLISGSPPAASR
jgi:WD40 repeat protein